MNNKQLYNILCYYLKNTGAFFNKLKLRQLITSHPDRNSLYAMTDTLDALHIDNVALRTDLKGLMANGFPAIVFVAEKGERRFCVVENINENQVYCYDDEKGKTVEPLDEFVNKWTGVVLYVAQGEIQAELARKKTVPETRLLQWRTVLSIVTGAVCITIWGASVVWSPVLICLFALFVMGLIISVLLAMHEFGESNSLLHKVCHLNRLTNCNDVLQSSASKLFGWLSMSDIGLCFFVGGILSLIFAGVTQQLDTVIAWLLVLTLCSFPYTLFSLSYQSLKVKKVCPLCLGVIGVLWVIIALAIFSWKGLVFSPISLLAVFSLLTGFALPIMVWAHVKPIWKENIRIRNYEYNYLRLKRMPAVIRALLSTEPINMMAFRPDEINLGKTDASIHITAVISSSCKPCANAWSELNQWIQAYPNKLWVTVRFTGYDSKQTDTELIDALTGIYLQSGSNAFCEALSSWYKSGDFQKWKAKYCRDSPITPQPLSLKTAKWQQEVFISAAPTIFVGDRIFRNELRDLEYLLKELQI
jgi:uncharacterized membrane protein